MSVGEAQVTRVTQEAIPNMPDPGRADRVQTRVAGDTGSSVVERAEIEEGVRAVLSVRGKLSADVSAIEASQSLYDAGMTSYATVKVMLGLEDQFGVEFPDEFLQRSVFDQITTIADAIEKLLREW